MTRRIDHHTRTVDGAAAFEAWRAEEEYFDQPPFPYEYAEDES